MKGVEKMKARTRRTLVASLVTVMLLAAGLGLSTADSAKKASGKELFKKHCKSCHLPDSPNGEYNPMSLIQDQWTRFFAKKYVKKHEKVLDPTNGNKPVTTVISPEDLKAIEKFAVDHAADSENPMTCG